jgi:hypothetical protein
MSMAEFPFGFPEYSVAELDEEEISLFKNDVLWPAAIYFWGTGFSDPRLLDENDDIFNGFDSPNNEEHLSLSFYLADDADREHDQTVVDIPPELVARIDMENIRCDLMDILPKACRGIKVWECLSYSFPIDGSEPWAHHYYMLESKKGRDITNPSREQQEFLEHLDGSDLFSLDRDERLNSQDLIDIQNILLTLGVSEEIILEPLN